MRRLSIEVTPEQHQRLKAIAALRAKTMQRMTRINFITNGVIFVNAGNAKCGEPAGLLPLSWLSKLNNPKEKPINAKGIAKMV